MNIFKMEMYFSTQWEQQEKLLDLQYVIPYALNFVLKLWVKISVECLNAKCHESKQEKVTDGKGNFC